MVSVDTVYQRVLALANKEQRGYISPIKFNLFANQAQMDIFEQYFYDRNQFGRVSGNSTMYGDPVDILEEKIEIFHTQETLEDNTNPSNVFNLNDLSNTYYRLASVLHENVKVEKLVYSKYCLVSNSPLTAPTKTRPVYFLQDTTITASPETVTSIDVNYIRKPADVNWSGINVNGSLVYSGNGTNFELHVSEETKLVVKILQLAAIEMKDDGLAALALREDNKNIQQEKQ
jgi:hypothetical protein